ncbi:MAG: cupin domain-containing protein [Ignavibacteriaceae bacterium]|nr:cupin domain-containing protein [Ignavibacteriaceae bacterium]
MNAKYWIHKLDLLKHPEGGYYKEIYRSEEVIPIEALPDRYLDKRNVSTSIYFMLDKEQVSHFHKLQSDEIWHFYEGSSLIIHLINEAGNYSSQKLGRNLDEGEVLQFVIPKFSWFAAEVNDKKSFSLIGCTVAPGFDFADFELAKREELIKQFPLLKKVVEQFTANINGNTD